VLYDDHHAGYVAREDIVAVVREENASVRAELTELKKLPPVNKSVKG
jgi:hypothetical protein